MVCLQISSRSIIRSRRAAQLSLPLKQAVPELATLSAWQIPALEFPSWNANFCIDPIRSNESKSDFFGVWSE